MNIIEEVKKMDKIPVELIKVIGEKVGNGDDWREEGETRGVSIVVVGEKRTMSVFSGTRNHLVNAYRAFSRCLDDHPEVIAVIEAQEFFESLTSEKEEAVDETVN